MGPTKPEPNDNFAPQSDGLQDVTPNEGVQSSSSYASQSTPAVETTESVTPVASTNGDQPTAVLPVKKSKKGLVAALIAVGAVLLLGGTAAGLALWWTSPQKALDDSVAQSLNNLQHGSAKGEFTMGAEGAASTIIKFDAKYADKVTYSDFGLELNMGMMSINLKGAGATDADKNAYFKIDDVKKTLNSMYQGQPIPAEVNSLVEKIDSKWVKITEQELKDLSKGEEGAEADQSSACVAEVLEKFSTNNSLTKDLVNVYNQNKFMTIKKIVGSETINGRDNHRIELDTNADKAKTFGEKLKQTEFFKEIEKCGNSNDAEADSNSTSSTGSDTVPTVEVWIDKWSHKITQLSIKTEEGSQVAKLVTTFDYNKPSVSAPTAETNFSEVKADFDALVEKQKAAQEQALQYYSGYGDSYGSLDGLEAPSGPMTVRLQDVAY